MFGEVFQLSAEFYIFIIVKNKPLQGLRLQLLFLQMNALEVSLKSPLKCHYRNKVFFSFKNRNLQFTFVRPTRLVVDRDKPKIQIRFGIFSKLVLLSPICAFKPKILDSKVKILGHPVDNLDLVFIQTCVVQIESKKLTL